MRCLNLYNGEVPKVIDDYFDEDFNLLCHARVSPGSGDSLWEGGDSMQREGMYVSACILKNNLLGKKDAYLYSHWLRRFELIPGYWTRHPDFRYWYSNPLNCSGDQHRSAMIALGYCGDKKTVWRFVKKQLKRFLFYPNIQHNGDSNWSKPKNQWQKGAKKVGDFAGPNHWGIWIRSLKAWYLYPLLFLADVQTLATVLLKIKKAIKDPDHSDDLNLIQTLLQSKLIYPTLLGHLAAFIYANFRPGYDVYEATAEDGRKKKYYVRNNTVSGAQYALNYYFYNRYAPPLNQEWKKLIDKHFNKVIYLM
jgi:hypothetical protein